MTTLLIFLTLLGCDDAIRACEVLAPRPQAFETRVACQGAVDGLLERSLDQPYPTLVAQCGTAAETVEFLESVTPHGERATRTAALRASLGS